MKSRLPIIGLIAALAIAGFAFLQANTLQETQNKAATAQVVAGGTAQVASMALATAQTSEAEGIAVSTAVSAIIQNAEAAAQAAQDEAGALATQAAVLQNNLETAQAGATQAVVRATDASATQSAAQAQSASANPEATRAAQAIATAQAVSTSAEADTRQLQGEQTALAATRLAGQAAASTALPGQVATAQAEFAAQADQTREADAAAHDGLATQAAATLDVLSTQNNAAQATLSALQTANAAGRQAPSTPPALLTAEAQSTQLHATLSALKGEVATLEAAVTETSAELDTAQPLSGVALTQDYRGDFYSMSYPEGWVIDQEGNDGYLSLSSEDQNANVVFFWYPADHRDSATAVVNGLRDLINGGGSLTLPEPESLQINGRDVAVASAKHHQSAYLVMVAIDFGDAGYVVLTGSLLDNAPFELYDLMLDITATVQTDAIATARHIPSAATVA